MDAEKIVEELVGGNLGDHIREVHVRDMIYELESAFYNDEREWADSVAEWLRENYL